MNFPERKWECQNFFSVMMALISGLSPLNFDTPTPPIPPPRQQAAALDRGYVLLMISRFHAWKACFVGWMKGSLFSLSLLSMSYLTSYILPPLFTASLTLEFACRTAEQYQRIYPFSHQTVSSLFLDRMVFNSEQQPFVSCRWDNNGFCRQENTSVWFVLR